MMVDNTPFFIVGAGRSGTTLLRLILAVLFRAGSIEITQGGEKFADYKDPRSRTPLVNNTAFKSVVH